MTDLKNYKVPSMFQNCNFGDTTMPDGTFLTAEEEPIVLNAGNIVFPSGWTAAQKQTFRDRQS